MSGAVFGARARVALINDNANGYILNFIDRDSSGRAGRLYDRRCTSETGAVARNRRALTCVSISSLQFTPYLSRGSNLLRYLSQSSSIDRGTLWRARPPLAVSRQLHRGDDVIRTRTHPRLIPSRSAPLPPRDIEIPRSRYRDVSDAAALARSCARCAGHRSGHYCLPPSWRALFIRGDDDDDGDDGRRRLALAPSHEWDTRVRLSARRACDSAPRSADDVVQGERNIESAKRSGNRRDVHVAVTLSPVGSPLAVVGA